MKNWILRMIDKKLEKQKARHKRRRNKIAKELHLNTAMHEKVYQDRKRKLKQDKQQEQKETKEYLNEHDDEMDIDTRQDVSFTAERKNIY